MKGGAIQRSAACLSPSPFFKDPHMESPSLAGSGNGLQGEGHGDGVGNVGSREESRNPVGFDVDLNLGPPLNGWPFEFHQQHFNLDLLGSLAEPASDLSRMVAVEAGFARMSSLLPENLVADSSVAEPLRGMSSLLQENLAELGVEPLAGNSIGFNRLLRESQAESAMGGAPFVRGLVGGSSLVEMREPLRIFGRILRQMGEELPPPNPRNGESLLSNTRNPPSRVRSRWQWRHMRRFQHDNTDLQASDTTIPTQLDCSLKPEKIADDLDETPEKSVNFDCNICLEMAKDSPVVTLCGHLFCWPCLYQWLYIHSLERKCPICKALILEKNIIPIYGRGKAEIANTNKDKQQGLLVIPPRPHAPVPSETQERELSSSGQNSGGLLANRGLPRDTISNAVSQVLDRLRVVQRLQRQYLEVRLQSRQRFEGRQVRSSNNSNSNNSGTGLVQDSNLTRLQMPVNVEARIGSMDSLHLNLPPLRQPSSGDNPHEIPEQLVELNELTNNRDSDQTSSPSQTCQRGTDTASGSSNVDPELLHVRKRRRLN